MRSFIWYRDRPMRPAARLRMPSRRRTVPLPENDPLGGSRVMFDPLSSLTNGSPDVARRLASVGGFATDPQAAARGYTQQRQMGIGDLLLENRIIFLAGPIMDDNANSTVMKLLYLQSENRHQDVHMYVNSPGGSVTA